jgi:hydrogenase maturation protease
MADSQKMQTQPGPVLVIGYGNDLRGDDGVGQAVAKHLWSACDGAPELAGTSFVWSVQLVPEMALDLSRASFAVFVDAAYDAGSPGSVNVHQLDNSVRAEGPIAAGASVSGCWLDLSPTGLLSLSVELYGHAPPADLVTVSVGAPTISPGLSPAVRTRVPAAALAVKRAIASWRRSARCPALQGGQVLNA